MVVMTELGEQDCIACIGQSLEAECPWDDCDLD